MENLPIKLHRMKYGGESAGMASEKSGKKLLITGLITVVVVVAVLVGIIIYLAVGRQEPEQQIKGRAVLLTEDNVQEYENQEPVEDGYYMVTMNTSWDFDDGKAESYNAYVANAPENTRTVYFDVFLSDTGENIYSSPYMPVGTELQDISLDKALEAGDYQAVVTYHLVDDDYNEIDDVSAEITIHILN